MALTPLLPSRMKRTCLALGRTLGVFVVTAGALSFNPPASDALAQTAPAEVEQIRPPTPGKQDSPPVILYWLVLAVTVILVVGVNLMPSKRGHQD